MNASVLILIVEDNPMNLELATDLLTAGGYTVSQAGSAEEGLRQAMADPPSLILMDLRLPGIDGYTALKQLRNDARTAHIPVVALTAQAMKGDEQAARDAGFDGYISKPINTRTFCQSVARLLRSQGDRS
ncbi:MAG TPA: response regulator [Gemmatimonadales bacterium]|nr:response regulator [Gemmatimonadales bacterium]